MFYIYFKTLYLNINVNHNVFHGCKSTYIQKQKKTENISISILVFIFIIHKSLTIKKNDFVQKITFKQNQQQWYIRNHFYYEIIYS